MSVPETTSLTDPALILGAEVWCVVPKPRWLIDGLPYNTVVGARDLLYYGFPESQPALNAGAIDEIIVAVIVDDNPQPIVLFYPDSSQYLV